MSFFRSANPGVRAKGYRDVVTDADVAAEKLITQALRESFPEDGIVGEEGASHVGSSDRRWLIDPVDGTLNYSRQLPIWCVSVSLFRGEFPEVGVIYDPLREETFEASLGGGARLNGAILGGSGCREAGQALVHVTVDFRQDSVVEGLDDLKVLAPVVLRTRNIGSAALALAYVAAGRFDAMLHRFASPWDYGAGVALVQEAGGVVTDFEGKPYSFDTSGLLASASPELHAAILELLQG